ncbi:response regulator transcription factor [Bacillus cereus]
MKRTILIVEDEDILREIMKDYLLNERYWVLEATDGKEALSIFKEQEVHVIIRDIMVPARGDDDTKPYSPTMLLTRAKRVMETRYSSPVNVSTQGTITSSGIHVHVPSRKVTMVGKEISLTHIEFKKFTYFMQKREIVITREQLITKILGYEFAGDDLTVNSHIRNLRHKLGQKSTCIVTVVRSSYILGGRV